MRVATSHQSAYLLAGVVITLLTIPASAAAQSCTASNFIVQYSSFIHVDHVDGPRACIHRLDESFNPIPIIYKGDAFRNTYRTTESMQVTPATQQATDVFRDDGFTWNYAAGPVGSSCRDASPINGATLSDSPPPLGDFDVNTGDCCLWNDIQQSQDHLTNFAGSATFQPPNIATVHFSGLGHNPLEPQIGGIQWDMTITVNATLATASVAYDHTCFPAHIVKVNGTIIYPYIPPSTSKLYILECLTNLRDHIHNSTAAVPVSTY